MLFSNFISARLSSKNQSSFSSIVSKIAVGSVASGIFIILISYAILLGFQRNIKNKIFSFGGHIQLTKYDLNNSLQENPILINQVFLSELRKDEKIRSISTFSLKAGLIKTEEEVLGTVLKGIDNNFNISAFENNITKGRFIKFSDTAGSKEILVSEKIAKKLKLQLNEEVIVFFIQNPPRFRKLKIVGLFSTGMDEFDESFILSDIKLIRKINNWNENMAGGYEIMINDFNQLDNVADTVFAKMDYDLGLEKITDKYITVFDWLVLLSQNVSIFLILIIVVASFNMISSLFIMIMERTQMIGILKALGASNFLIVKIFFNRGILLIFWGLLIGNISAAVFCLLQYYFKILPLDAENYYMNSVPIEWDWLIWLYTNVLLSLSMALIVFIPCLAIANIKPIRAIRFD
ncbi:MAG: ABC transporter permease [Cytophagales bacterium]